MPMASEDLLRDLVRHEGLGASIYMPTHSKESEIEQNPIRLKNLLREAEEKLVQAGLRAPLARERLRPIETLLGDTSFWRRSEGGLALFAAEGRTERVTAPIPFEELVVVSDRFHVKPLLAVLPAIDPYRLLAISKRGLRLYEGTEAGLEEIPLPDELPSFEEEMREDETEKQLQYHTGTPQGGATRSAVFHGQGIGGDDARMKKELARYFEKADRALEPILHRGGTLPLVLAGLDYLLAAYRRTSGYPLLLEDAIVGNPDDLAPEELHARSQDLVASRRASALDAARERTLRGIESGKASRDIEEAVQAAHRGRIAAIFVPLRAHRWGRHDAEAGSVAIRDRPAPSDDDLLDRAAALTYLHGGEVFVLDESDTIPGGGDVGALLRY